MTTAIGVVITNHIVAGRLEDHRLVAKPLRYPTDPEESGRALCPASDGTLEHEDVPSSVELRWRPSDVQAASSLL